MSLAISVIICTRNRFDDFKKTIASLIQQSRMPDEFIVVDSSDSLQIEEYLNSIELPINVHYFHTEPGLTLQRNYGIHESRGDLLFFFDDDVDLDVNYITQAEKIFETDTPHEIGAVGGRIVNLFGNHPATLRFWIELKIFTFLRNLFGLDDLGSGNFRYSGMPTHPHAFTKSRYIECLSGCCMAFRHEVFEKIQFDESLPNYGLMEDVDISKQTLDAGYKIYYETSATLLHNESPRNRLNQYGMAEMTVVNYTYLFHKNWNKNGLRKIAFYWASLGLIVVNLTKKEGLRGTLSGIAKLKQR
jgi:GT2 family glycosyltransferase